MARDITERKQAEEALKESESRFKAIFDGANDGILVADVTSKKFTTGNARMCKMLGYSPEDLPILGVADIHPAENLAYVQSQFEKQAQGDIGLSTDIPMKRKDGSIFYADVNAFRIILGGKTYLAGFFRDITERKAMEAELKRKEEMMIAQSRQAAMGDMIAMIAHQWRQPITVIAMAANNVRLGIELEEPITSDTLLKMTDTITEQTQHLSKTIDDFRNFFKPNKERQYVTLCKVLGDTLGIVGKSLENNDIRLEFSQTCRREIFTFPNELLQVFLNLIGNAKDALIRSKTADAVIRITVVEGEEEIRTIICDNDGGIPEAILDKIGQPYFTTKEEGGTGLGLYMSKTIVEKHLHGKLTWENVQTDKGAGACFIVTMPIKPKEEE